MIIGYQYEVINGQRRRFKRCKSLASWLENEIADVITGIELVEKRFGLMRLEGRIAKKTKHLSQWHNLA